MPDETTTTEGAPAAAAATTTAAHGAGGPAGGPRPDPLPTLYPGSTDQKWILYLQQMLNYHYQSQVVMESGDYDSQTGDAVAHFRSQQGIGQGPITEADVWDKLGVQDPAEAWDRAHPQGAGQHGGAQHGAGQHGAGQGGAGHGAQQGGQHGEHADGQQQQQFTPVHFNVSMIPMTTDGTCWAAAMAMVLNTKLGGSLTAESVCEQGHVQANDHKSASEVVHIGTELGLQHIACDGSTAAGWATAMASTSGPLWAPNPQNDSNVLVIAGVEGSGEGAYIRVMDPVTNYDDWLEFSQFIQYYGFTNHHELLG